MFASTCKNQAYFSMRKRDREMETYFSNISIANPKTNMMKVHLHLLSQARSCFWFCLFYCLYFPSAICNPVCLNGATCTRPSECQCTPGFKAVDVKQARLLCVGGGLCQRSNENPIQFQSTCKQHETLSDLYSHFGVLTSRASSRWIKEQCKRSKIRGQYDSEYERHNIFSPFYRNMSTCCN